MAADWLATDAAELGRAIERGAADPRDVAEAALAAIAAHPAADRIYARTTPDRARAEAAASSDRARRGLRRGPLDGVPVSWKDLFDTAGVPTEAGSALLAGRVPETDAAVLVTATRAGLVCLGKTHMSELAFSGLGVNPVTATPPNRHGDGRAPGGSSSGAAASVALGLAAAAVGSDTGGSVRVPAAWNDLVGLKTSVGALPLAGVVPLARRFDTVGPLCRTVADAALMLGALSGARPADLAGAALGGVRLLALVSPALPAVDAAPADAAGAALDRLAAAGARITRGPVPAVDAALGLSGCLYAGEAYGIWRDEIEARPDAMFFQSRDRFRSGAAYAAADYVAAWERLATLRAGYRTATADFDAVAVGTTPNLAPSVERLLAEPAHFTEQNLLALRNTRIANLMDLCALTLPTATPGCGLTLMAPAGAEARLLRLGAAAERALRR